MRQAASPKVGFQPATLLLSSRYNELKGVVQDAMHKNLAHALPLTARRIAFAMGLAATLIATAPRAHAQFGAPPTTPVHDPAALKPPAGARVAIVEFEDMECPDCANANPLLREAAAKYNIPWIRHDFPLPFHPWSFQAAVNARWFDTKSKKLGDDYRDAVFANQPSISNLDVLRQFTESFAKSHNVALPFAIDPQGKFAAEVNADRDVGKAIKLEHTPTVYVVSSRHPERPYVEMKDSSQLYLLIDAMMKE